MASSLSATKSHVARRFNALKLAVLNAKELGIPESALDMDGSGTMFSSMHNQLLVMRSGLEVKRDGIYEQIRKVEIMIAEFADEADRIRETEILETYLDHLGIPDLHIIYTDGIESIQGLIRRVEEMRVRAIHAELLRKEDESEGENRDQDKSKSADFPEVPGGPARRVHSLQNETPILGAIPIWLEDRARDQPIRMPSELIENRDDFIVHGPGLEAVKPPGFNYPVDGVDNYGNNRGDGSMDSQVTVPHFMFNNISPVFPIIPVDSDPIAQSAESHVRMFGNGAETQPREGYSNPMSSSCVNPNPSVDFNVQVSHGMREFIPAQRNGVHGYVAAVQDSDFHISDHHDSTEQLRGDVTTTQPYGSQDVRRNQNPQPSLNVFRQRNQDPPTPGRFPSDDLRYYGYNGAAPMDGYKVNFPTLIPHTRPMNVNRNGRPPMYPNNRLDTSTPSRYRAPSYNNHPSQVTTYANQYANMPGMQANTGYIPNNYPNAAPNAGYLPNTYPNGTLNHVSVPIPNINVGPIPSATPIPSTPSTPIQSTPIPSTPIMNGMDVLTQFMDSRSRTPQLPLTVFDGTQEKWKKWWAVFSYSVHDNKTMSEAEKIMQLSANLKGEPAMMIEHFDAEPEFYQQCITMLQDRYNKGGVTRQKIVQRLQEIPMSSKSIKDIRATFVKVHSGFKCLNALENSETNTILLDLIKRKFPDVYQTKIGKWVHSLGDEWTMTEVMKKLEAYVVADEAGSSFKPTESPSEVPATVAAIQSHPIPRSRRVSWTENGIVDITYTDKPSEAPSEDEPRQGDCGLCQGNGHHAIHCLDTSDINERRSLVVKNRLCYICLSRNHSARDCAADLCKKCRGKHHHTLCDGRDTSFHRYRDNRAESPYRQMVQEERYRSEKKPEFSNRKNESSPSLRK